MEFDTLNHFNQFGIEFENLSRDLFALEKVEDRVSRLDAFFLGLINLKEDKRIRNAINLIYQNDAQIKANDLAILLKINRKTLLRLFKKYIGYSFKDFISVARFRLTLHQYQTKMGKLKLSDIAYDNTYYDHSHMIRDYQSITGLSPKTLFESIKRKGSEGLYWTYPSDSN